MRDIIDLKPIKTKGNIMMKYTGSFIVICSLVVWFAIAISKWASIPVVQYSHSSGECVQVVNFVEDDRYTCSKLPDRYTREWAK